MLVVMAAVSGCGYRMAESGYLNESVTRVAVTVFENNTSESRAGVSFSNELIREITQKSDTEVVSVDNATRVIEGTVKAITFSTQSRSSDETVTEREVTARVDVKLTGPDGNILWSVKDFTSSESYTVSSDSEDDQAAKNEAVETIAERVAERLVSLMLSRF
ncbi:MAG: LPS assembly lipoprotein LptE [Desulfobacterales bacterium]|nr:LPS assembly lipoprotein LptE [Desulfobacterales bacterium]